MQVDYYNSLMSPWACFGAPRLYGLQKKLDLLEEDLVKNI